MDSGLKDFISSQLKIDKFKIVSIGGGSINDTFRIETLQSRFFCKINSLHAYPKMFEKEKNGLSFLEHSNTIKVARVIFCEEYQEKQVLVLEWIEQGLRTNAFWKKFGEELAKLHLWRLDGDLSGNARKAGRHTAHSSDRYGQPSGASFGFHEDNYMGALPQTNSFKEKWIEFFVECRLEPQLKLATDNGLLSMKETELFGSLYRKLEDIFPPEASSALHGDLWSGNYLCDQHETPVLIDPAVYYGHRCMDLGMTKLFGGFNELFYEAYNYHYPLPKNFDEQAHVCNLYPLLIHLNLFGSGYLSSIKNILNRYN